MQLRFTRFPFFALTLLAIEFQLTPANAEVTGLQLFNTNIFGKSTKNAVVLIQKKPPGAIVPQTVMVDIDKDCYYAATVRYRKKDVTLGQVREFLNTTLRKWESANFSDNPTMGIWRNDDEEYSIQLTEDDETIVVIYLKLSLLTDEMIAEGISKAVEKQTTEELRQQSPSR